MAGPDQTFINITDSNSWIVVCELNKIREPTDFGAFKLRNIQLGRRSFLTFSSFRSRIIKRRKYQGMMSEVCSFSILTEDFTVQISDCHLIRIFFFCKGPKFLNLTL